jgi:hypothetical protein
MKILQKIFYCLIFSLFLFSGADSLNMSDPIAFCLIEHNEWSPGDGVESHNHSEMSEEEYVLNKTFGYYSSLSLCTSITSSFLITETKVGTCIWQPPEMI